MRAWWLRFCCLVLGGGMWVSSALAGPTATPTPVNATFSISVTQSVGETRLLPPGKYRVTVKPSAWSLCNTSFIDPRATPVPAAAMDTCNTNWVATRSYSAAYRVYGAITGLTYFNTGGPAAGRPGNPVNDCFGNSVYASWPYTGPDGSPYVDRDTALRYSTNLWAEFTVPGPSAVLVGFTAGDCTGGIGFYDNSGNLSVSVEALSLASGTPTPVPSYTPTATPLPTACSSQSLLQTSDIDKDGVVECSDQCEGDATKTKYGTCGCGYAETQVLAVSTIPAGNTPRPCENPASTTLRICDVKMTGVTKFDRKIARLRWKVFPNLQGPDNRVVCEVSRFDKRRNTVVARWSYKNKPIDDYLAFQANNPRIPPFPTPYVQSPPPPAPFYYPFPTPQTASFDVNAKFRSTTAEGGKQRRLFSKLKYAAKGGSDEYQIRCLMTNLSTTNPENNKSTTWKTVGGIQGNFVGEKCPLLLARPAVPTMVPVPSWTPTPTATATTPPAPTSVPGYPPTPTPAWYYTGYGTCNTTLCQETQGALCLDNSGTQVATGLCGAHTQLLTRSYCESALCASTKDAASSYSESPSTIFVYGGRTGGTKCAQFTLVAWTPKTPGPTCQNSISYFCDTGSGSLSGTVQANPGTQVSLGPVCNYCRFQISASGCHGATDWRTVTSPVHFLANGDSTNCRGVNWEDSPFSGSPDYSDAAYQVCWQ